MPADILDFNAAINNLDGDRQESLPVLDFQGAALGLDDQQARANLYGTADTNPDQAAKALDLSRRSGMPPSLVEGSEAQVQAQLDFDAAVSAMDGKPATTRFLADPENAKVARDSVAQLAAAEEAWAPWVLRQNVNAARSLGAGVIDTPGATLRGLGEAYGVFGRALSRSVYGALSAVGLKDFADALQGTSVPWFLDPSAIISRPGDAIGEIADMVAPPEEERNLLTDVSGGVGQVAAQIAAAIATGGASTYVSLAMMLGQGVDQQTKMIEQSGAEEDALTDAAKIAGGAITALTERWGLDNLLNRIPNTFKGPLFRMLAGGASEAFQEVIEGIWQSLTALALYDPEADVFEGMQDEATTASIVGALVSMVIPGRAAIQRRDQMDRAHDALAEAPLSKRAPDAVAAHQAEVLRQQGIEEVYMPVSALDEYAKSLPDPDAFLDQLGVANQVEEARALGGDVRITGEALARHIMMSDDYQKLRSNIRFTEDGMTGAEADEFAKSGVRETAERLEAEEVSRDTSAPSRTSAFLPDWTVAEREREVYGGTEISVGITPSEDLAQRADNAEAKGGDTTVDVEENGLFLTSETGEIGGEEKTILSVRRAGLLPGLRGQGLGLQMYEIAAEVARRRGLVFASDVNVTPEAARVWKALAARGYVVQERGAGDSDGPHFWVDPKAPVPPLDVSPDVSPEADEFAKSGVRETAERLEAEEVSRDTTPPPAEGFVRLYHGGTVDFSEDDQFGRWVTPDPVYAQGYAEKSGGAVYYVDVPADYEGLEKSFDDTGTDQIAPFLAFEAPNEVARQLKLFVAPAPAPDISPEADQAVGLAEQEMGLQALFRTAQDAGMTPKWYERYLAAVQRSADGARRRIQRALLREQERELSKEWKAERETVREMMRESVNQRPLYGALNSLGRDRMDRKAVLEYLGGNEAELARLPKVNGRTIYTAKGEKGGVNPEIVASNYGFDGTDIMLFQMLDTYEPVDQVIDRETDAEMVKRHGSLKNQLDAVKSAIEALHHDNTAEVLAQELDALRGAQKEGRMKPAFFRKVAKDRLQGYQVSDIRVRRFLDAQKKHGRTAARLLRKGDRQGAAQAKFQQLLNFQYAAEAFDVMKKVEKQRKDMKALRKEEDRKNIDAGKLDKIKEALAPYDLDSKYGGLTLADWTALHDRVTTLAKQGRELKQYRIGQRKMEFEALKMKLHEQSEGLDTLARVERMSRFQNPSEMDEARSIIAHGRAKLNKVEFMLRYLDGGVIAGLWYRAIFSRVESSQTRYLDVVHRTLTPIVEQARALAANTKMRQKITVPSLGRTFERSDLLMLALNVGNISNYEKLLEGSTKDRFSRVDRWTPQGIDQALSNLTDAEWDWVQSVWDASEKLYPEVEALYREENGRSPEKIEPREYVTPSGKKVKGGYFPMMYDPARTPSRYKKEPTAEELLAHPAIGDSVFSGMTKARTGYSAPILLNLEALPRAVEQAAHFATHYEAVRDVTRILRDPEVEGIIQDKLGPEAHEEMQRWVGSIAAGNVNTGELKGPDQMFDLMRRNITAAVLGASYTTMIAQTFGLSSSVATLGKGPDGAFSTKEGVKWLMVGLDRYATDRSAAIKQAFALSGEMRHRIANTDREISNAMENMRGRSSRLAQVQRTVLLAVGGMQLYTVDLPTWIGAYNKALSEGRVGKNAVEFADSVVRTSQGSGHLKDLSAVQRQKGAWRILTMFSTYALTLYNMQAEIFKDMAKPKNLPAAVARLTWTLPIPAMADALMRMELPGEDEDEPLDYATWFAAQTLALSVSSVPVIGSMAGSMLRGFDASVSPIEMLGDNMTRALKRIAKRVEDGEEFSEKDYAALVLAIGPWVGVPGTFQIGRILRTVEDSDDATLYDYLIGYKEQD